MELTGYVDGVVCASCLSIKATVVDNTAIELGHTLSKYNARQFKNIAVAAINFIQSDEFNVCHECKIPIRTAFNFIQSDNNDQYS